MSLNGRIKIKFGEAMFMNPKYLNKKRLLQDQNQTNTTWVIYEEAPGPVEIPDEKQMVFDPSQVDSRMLDVKVNPSAYSIESMQGIKNWMATDLSKDQMTIQVLFQNYQYISTDGLDTLVVKMKESDVFLSQKDGKQIFYKG